MTILRDLEKYVSSDDLQNINSIIQTLFIDYQCNNNNQKPVNNYKQKEIFQYVIFYRKYESILIQYINNSHKKTDIIEEFLNEAKIIDKNYLNVFKKKNKSLSLLADNTINFIRNIYSEELYYKLIKVVLSYGFTNEKFFVDCLVSDEYCDFIKTNYIDYDEHFETQMEDILLELDSLYTLNDYQYQYNKNKKKVNIDVILKKLFTNYLLTLENIDKILFTNSSFLVKKIFDITNIPENFELEPVYFEIFLNLELFSIIKDLFVKNKIKNLDKCYNILCKFIKSLPNTIKSYSVYNDINKYIIYPQNEIKLNEHKTNKYLSQTEKTILLNIYEMFLDKNYFDYNIFNYFFKNNCFDYIELCIKKNKYPTEENFIYYLINSNKDDKKYFENIIFNEEHLYLACLYKKENIIKEILNQKVKPTKKCFNALFQIGFDNIIVDNFANIVKNIIELFIIYSYRFDENDLLVTINKKIKINENFVAKLIDLNEDLKLKIYDISHIDFTPEYWENIYKDINWVHKMCKISTKNEDFKKIKILLKNEKLNLDKQAYLYLKLNKSMCGEKTELLNSYKKK